MKKQYKSMIQIAEKITVGLVVTVLGWLITQLVLVPLFQPSDKAETTTITVSFISDGVLVGSRVCTYGDSYGTMLTPPRREGYIFSGWFTNSSFTGSAVMSGTLIDINSDHNLYARWIE